MAHNLSPVLLFINTGFQRNDGIKLGGGEGTTNAVQNFATIISVRSVWFHLWSSSFGGKCILGWDFKKYWGFARKERKPKTTLFL